MTRPAHQSSNTTRGLRVAACGQQAATAGGGSSATLPCGRIAAIVRVRSGSRAGAVQSRRGKLGCGPAQAQAARSMSGQAQARAAKSGRGDAAAVPYYRRRPTGRPVRPVW
ncbi:hypothetical protein MA16_Dca001432 [Dendrobium catenatum]|uniref:Uncharacterized protein n=1 Tax=Dendrobium catenatum TaxID=906689 RepID=A0A2I0WME9_9ASPA|nr:hypothetical protein MA16_Dca001432 [Dendrobium catenatum]